MMDKLVQEFPAQLREAIEIAKNAKINAHDKPLKHILLSGLGGSGIGGNFVANLVQKTCPIPFLINKGYHLPGWVNEESLLIVSSYSGNTEETYNVLQEGLKSGAKIVCIASGGKIIDFAKENGLDFIQLPAGKPSPRACLGYSFVQQIGVLAQLGLIDNELLHQIEASADFLDKEQNDIKEKAKRIAGLLEGKTPIIYVEDRLEPVAVRFRQQLNENSKILCWHHVVPEMNHNELVGWRDDYSNFAVIFFRNKDDYARNQVRMDLNKEIIGQYVNTLIEIQSKGENMLERSMYLVHMGDWISVDLADLRKMDSMEVKVIDYLKGELGRV